ncbi:unnamed protein product [Penicillium manginii]
MASDEHMVSQREASTAEMMRRIQTAENVLMPIPHDVFVTLYLTPKTPIAGSLRRTFGAFLVVQGTMMIPFVAVGQNYYSTGNSRWNAYI